MTIQYRKFRQTDIPEIIDIINLIRQQDSQAQAISEQELRHIVAAPHIRAEENFFVALVNDKLVAASLVMLRKESGLCVADIMIHPDYRENPIAGELLERSEKQILVQVQEELSDDMPIQIIFPVNDKKAYLRPALEQLQYKVERRQYVMRIALDNPCTKALFPSQFAFRAFEKERDGQAVHAVFQECFAEHWGEVGKIPYKEWSHQFSAPDFDPTIWYVLYQQDEIAAICLCELSNKESDLGLIEILGVRPKFRKQGLGALLLAHAFYEFQKRGFRYVALDVDTENSTNAVALYEGVGMRVESSIYHFSKMLRT